MPFSCCHQPCRQEALSFCCCRQPCRHQASCAAVVPREREREGERGGVRGRGENYAMQKRKVGIEAETFIQQKAPVFERARRGFYGLAVCDRQAHVPLSRTSRGLRVGILLKAKASERPAPPAPHPDPRRYTRKQSFVFLGGFLFRRRLEEEIWRCC
jgi:hypothetical protein